MCELIELASKGDLKSVEILIEGGININQTCKKNANACALHLASKNNQLNVVKYLLYKGVDVRAETNYGYTPLHFACEENHLEVVKCLVDNGAEIRAKDTHGCTPLSIASLFGYLDIAKYLLENGAYINDEDENGWAALHMAVIEGHLELVEYLLKKYAIFDCLNNNHKRSIYIASKNGHEDVVNLLKEYKPKLEEEKLMSTKESEETLEEQLRNTKKTFDNCLKSNDFKIRQLEEKLMSKEKLNLEKINKLEEVKKDFERFIKNHNVEIMQLEEMLMSKEELNMKQAEKLEEAKRNFEASEVNHDFEIKQLEGMLISEKELNIEQAEVLEKVIAIKEKAIQELTELQTKYGELSNSLDDLTNDNTCLRDEKDELFKTIEMLSDELAKMKVKLEENKIIQQPRHQDNRNDGWVEKKEQEKKQGRAGLANLFKHAKGLMRGNALQKAKEFQQGEVVTSENNMGAGMNVL